LPDLQQPEGGEMSLDYFGLAWKVTFPGKPLKKLVLLCLADHHNDDLGFAWPSYKTLAKRTGMHRRTVITAVKALEKEGFVTVVERQGIGKRNTSNVYYLNVSKMKAAAAEYDADVDGDPRSPLNSGMVIHDHHDGDPRSPTMVADDHHDGDPRSPNLLSNLLSEPLGKRPASPKEKELTAKNIWEAALKDLEEQMSKATFKSWLQTTTAGRDGDTLVVHVKNQAAIDWLSNRLDKVIVNTVARLAGRAIPIRYEVAQ
jgi:hypothetical protein